MENETINCNVTKLCYTCNTVKPISEFNKRKVSKDGFTTRCRQCSKIKKKKYYQENPDKYICKAKHWYYLNKERAKANRKRNGKKPKYKIKKSLYRRLQNLLKGEIKYHYSVGCTNSELVIYLEKQFKPGMTWENYGTAWHIDHIRPLASFDLTIYEERCKANHYTNLQPLWAHENLTKAAKWGGFIS